MSSEYEKEYEWVCGGSSEDQDFFLNVCQRQWEQKKKAEMWLWDASQRETPVAKSCFFLRVLDWKSKLAARGELFSSLESYN